MTENRTADQRAQMLAWLTGKIDACEARRQALWADDRGDEANFEKVVWNVYDIFRTVLNVAGKTCGGDEAAAWAFFLQRLRTIPAPWETSLQQAEVHGETERAHIESLKLAVAREITEKSAELWRQTP